MSDNEKRFQLRISEALYNKIEAWADKELRSVNNQIIKILREAVQRREREELEGGKIEDSIEARDLVEA